MTRFGCVVSVFAIGSVVWAHDIEPVWLDASLEDPVWLDVDAPHVTRGVAESWVSVSAARFAPGDAVLVRLTVTGDDGIVHVSERPARLLPSVGQAKEEARLAIEDLGFLADAHDVEGVEAAGQCLHEVSHIVEPAIWRERWFVPESALGVGLTIQATIITPTGMVVVEERLRIPTHPSLPDGTAEAVVAHVGADGVLNHVESQSRQGEGVWFAGDQHLHCQWSLDAWVLDGTDVGVAFYADTARSMDLDWVMITDHSNINAWWFGQWFYTPEQHAAARDEAVNYRADNDWPAMYSQEMGVGSQGFWDLPSHMLVYPLDTWDAPFIENPSDGLVFGHANCESEQVIIDRVNNAGCFGFLAHPFSSGTLTYTEWDWGNGATGWAGLEIFSHASGLLETNDVQAQAKWHELLRGLGAPSNLELPARPGFPSRFPIGVGNSDAHAPGDIGAAFTYARMSEVSPATLKEAFLGGRCVASNGPLVTLEVNTAGIGNVALLPDGYAQINVRLESTSEFGAVADFDLVVELDGKDALWLPTSEIPGYAVEFIVEAPDLLADTGHVTVTASTGASHAFTNPVFIQPSVLGDTNGDGAVNVSDLLLILADWGACSGCPTDLDHDDAVSVKDVLLFLSVMD